MNMDKIIRIALETGLIDKNCMKNKELRFFIERLAYSEYALYEYIRQDIVNLLLELKNEKIIISSDKDTNDALEIGLLICAYVCLETLSLENKEYKDPYEKRSNTVYDCVMAILERNQSVKRMLSKHREYKESSGFLIIDPKDLAFNLAQTILDIYCYKDKK